MKFCVLIERIPFVFSSRHVLVWSMKPLWCHIIFSIHQCFVMLHFLVDLAVLSWSEVISRSYLIYIFCFSYHTCYSHVWLYMVLCYAPSKRLALSHLASWCTKESKNEAFKLTPLTDDTIFLLFGFSLLLRDCQGSQTCNAPSFISFHLTSNDRILSIPGC